MIKYWFNYVLSNDKFENFQLDLYWIFVISLIIQILKIFNFLQLNISI